MFLSLVTLKYWIGLKLFLSAGVVPIHTKLDDILVSTVDCIDYTKLHLYIILIVNSATSIGNIICVYTVQL